MASLRARLTAALLAVCAGGLLLLGVGYAAQQHEADGRHDEQAGDQASAE